jgi:hypothetical protein
VVVLHLGMMNLVSVLVEDLVGLSRGSDGWNERRFNIHQTITFYYFVKEEHNYPSIHANIK